MVTSSPSDTMAPTTGALDGHQVLVGDVEVDALAEIQYAERLFLRPAEKDQRVFGRFDLLRNGEGDVGRVEGLQRQRRVFAVLAAQVQRVARPEPFALDGQFADGRGVEGRARDIEVGDQLSLLEWVLCGVVAFTARYERQQEQDAQQPD